jgi:SAM-dependent methyltransferase
VDYREQSKFFARYRMVAASLVAAAAGCFLWAFPRAAEAGWYGSALLALAGAGVAYCLWYMPLYLQLSVEYRKRFAWSVRVRWALIPALAALTLPLVAANGRWGAWVACVAIAATGALAARALLKSSRELLAELVPLALLLSDWLVVLVAVAYGSLPASGAAMGFALAWLLAVLGLGRPHGRGRPAVQAALWVLIAVVTPLTFQTLLAAFPDGLPVGAGLFPVVVAAGAVVLGALAERHHRAGVAATVADLSEFARVPPAHATEMLAHATGILAKNWNADAPKEPAEIARWYSENSQYYLYDLAQFHLAYKHIAFMRDVVSLARGRVLDHGAGIGDVALELARRGHETTYLDVDGVTKAFARWRAERAWLPVTFVSRLEEAEGPFDTIISLDVLEHLPEPEAEVDALVERLAPGGRIVVTAYFGPTKAHPMHFDHKLDLGAYLRARGLRDAKTFAMRHLRSEFLRKRGVLVYEK